MNKKFEPEEANRIENEILGKIADRFRGAPEARPRFIEVMKGLRRIPLTTREEEYRQDWLRRNTKRADRRIPVRETRFE